jgi:hypothetical protein
MIRKMAAEGFKSPPRGDAGVQLGPGANAPVIVTYTGGTYEAIFRGTAQQAQKKFNQPCQLLVVLIDRRGTFTVASLLCCTLNANVLRHGVGTACLFGVAWLRLLRGALSAG